MKNQQKFFHSTQNDCQFLFYKTDETPCGEQSGEEFFSKSIEILTETYPGMLFGQDFLNQAMAHVQASPCFCAVVMRIDVKPGQSDVFSSQTCRIAVNAIRRICLDEAGVWGLIYGGLFACVFPGKDSDAGLCLAKEIQKQMTQDGGQTTIIGVAAYPNIDFERSRIIDNAQKALIHASFFGPGSVVVFDAVSLNISGDHFYQHGCVAEAIDEFSAALKIDPQNINVLNSLGVCYGMTGDFDKAIAQFETAIQLEPEEAMAWYNTGLVYKLKKDDDKALEYFLKAGEVNGNLFEVAFQTGKIYFEKGLPETGRQYYQKALELKPESNLNYRFLGECYAEMGLLDEAVAAYKKAIKEHPNDAGSLSALGGLFDQKGESPEIALLFCQQSVDISPENGLFRHRLGFLYAKQQKPEQAMVEFATAVKLGYDSSDEIQKLESAFKNGQESVNLISAA
jgi:tetratricopeptide (TPR) repeat protein